MPVEGASEAEDSAALAASLADALDLPSTARAVRLWAVRGASAPGGRPQTVETEAVLATLDHEAARLADGPAGDALGRARALLACAERDVAAGHLGPSYFDGYDRWAAAARHFDDALEAAGGRSSAVRRAAACARALRHLWLVEATIKPLEARAFYALRSGDGVWLSPMRGSLLEAVHRFAEVERCFPVTVRGTAERLACADAMLLRNAVAHAAVAFEPSGAIEATFSDREADRLLAVVRLTPRQLDEWFEALVARVRAFAFLAALVGALASAEGTASRSPLVRDWALGPRAPRSR